MGFHYRIVGSGLCVAHHNSGKGGFIGFHSMLLVSTGGGGGGVFLVVIFSVHRDVGNFVQRFRHLCSISVSSSRQVLQYLSAWG